MRVCLNYVPLFPLSYPVGGFHFRIHLYKLKNSARGKCAEYCCQLQIPYLVAAMENMNEEKEQRIDTAFRYIKAPADKIYKALTIPAQLIQWKAPKGMRIEIFHYNFRVDGTYRLALYYNDRSQQGKAGNNSDIVLGRFIELIANRKITEAVHFQSNDPAFTGEMIMTTELEPEKGGTKVTITATQVPVGISQEDHMMGIESSLANLAQFTE